MAALALGVPLNLWGWWRALVGRRAIADTPTSRVASAAQGFVELQGRARRFGDVQLASPLNGLPCVWYRYVVEEKKGDDWREIDSGESDLPVELDDGSGRCEIAVQGAEVHTRHKSVRLRGDERTTEYLLLEGDPLYALGDFRSEGGEHLSLQPQADVRALLAEWKGDRHALLQRFDANGDGELDEAEWALARQAAQAHVAATHQALRQAPPRHRLQPPADGRPLLVSNWPPEHLGRRYLAWAGLYLTLFLACLSGLGWWWRVA